MSKLSSNFKFLLLTMAFALIGSSTLKGNNGKITYVYVKLAQPDQRSQSKSSSAPFLNNVGELPHVASFQPLQYGKSNLASAKNKRPVSKYLNGISQVQLDADVDVDLWLRRARLYDNVIYAERESSVELLLIPNDVRLASQQYLENIRAFDAWDLTRGDTTVRVGISDAGVDYNHEDLIGKLAVNHLDPVNGIDDDGNGYVDDYIGWDMADGDKDPMGDTPIGNPSHGTMVAGISNASTDNGLGIAGVGFDTKYVPIKVFKSTNGFANGTYQSIIYAADLGLDVLNMSWGSRSTPSVLLQDVINYAVLEKDLVLVAAAGNTDDELDYYPASYDHVLSVAMSDLDDEKHALGTYSYRVDLMAPGGATLSTKNNDSYGSDLGSSYAAPQVAAAAALVKSVFPDMTAVQIMEQVRVTSDDVYDVGNNVEYLGKLGHGRLNVLNAVSQTDEAAVRSFGYEYAGAFGYELYSEDTVTISLGFVNILRAINNGRISVSSSSPYVEILNDELLLGSMTSMDSVKDLTIKVRLTTDIPEGYKVGVRLDYSDALGYEDFEYLSFTTSSDYLLLTNDNIEFVVGSDGRIGYAKDGLLAGVGLVRQEQRLGDYFGLMVGQDAENLKDNVINDYGQITYEGDFEAINNVKLKSRENVDVFASGSFGESSTEHSLGVLVEQKYYLWSGENENDFSVIEFRLTNTEDDTLKNLNLGLFTDFNLGDTVHNFVSWDAESEMGYTYSSNADIMVGISLITDQSTLFTAIDLFDSVGNAMDIDSVFTDENKFELFSLEKFAAGGDNGTNVGMLMGTSLDRLAGKGSSKIALALVFGNSMEALNENLVKAKEKYELMVNFPPVNWVAATCGIDSVFLANESPVLIYSDPLGMDLLDSGVHIGLGVIDHDSTLYYKEVADGYQSDIYSLLVSIANPETNFKANPALLYLDDVPNNTVQFEDLSLSASSWQWDFDNGSFSTLQNPKTSFQETGIFQVNLKAATTHGCEETITLPFEVRERGVAPVISNQKICKGQSATIKGNQNEQLNVYASELSIVPLFSGEEFATPILENTTTYYVSSIATEDESIRVQVQIEVDPVDAAFMVMPDTLDLSANDLMRIINQSTNASSISWELEGQSQEGLPSITFDYSGLTSVEIKLSAMSDLGCESIQTESVDLLTSNNGGINGVTICQWESVLTAPLHGELFVFYADENRTKIVGKGSSQLFGPIGGDTTFYIANISNYLESELISFDVEVDEFETEIVTLSDSSVFGSNPNIQFSIDNQSATSTTWYVDQELAAIDLTPSFSFNELKEYEVLAVSNNRIGCLDSASLTYRVYKVLSTNDLSMIVKVYPMPAGEKLQIDAGFPISNLELVDLLGRRTSLAENVPAGIYTFDIHTLETGMYVLTFYVNQKQYFSNFVIE